MRNDLIFRLKNSLEVGFDCVFPDHALGVEVGGVEGDGVAHHSDEMVALIVIEREDDVFELVVKRGGGTLGGVVDGPAGESFDAAFHPPAVEHAEAGHAVECGFHAAGAAGFHW